MTAFDAERVSRTITGALGGPGGVALVVTVFAGIPGVIHTPARRGFFSSDPERVQIGDWRYEIARDGRLLAAHVVNGIVIAEDVLPATAQRSFRISTRPSTFSTSTIRTSGHCIPAVL